MTTLLMSSRHTEDDQALWRASVSRGWSVARARGIRLPDIDDSEIVIYVESLYSPTIAKMIGRELLSPPDNWLVTVPQEFTKRAIALTTLGEARILTQPAFVKPPNDKSFAAQVYDSGTCLPVEFDDDMSVLVADPVQWDVEFRCFCLDGKVQTLSPYLRSGILAKLDDYEMTPAEETTVTEFTETVLAGTQAISPRAIVIDVGLIRGRGWAVVEANSAWGSGIYGCDPDAVLDVIRHATVQPAKES